MASVLSIETVSSQDVDVSSLMQNIDRLSARPAPFRFLGLPPEMRNMVYVICLPSQAFFRTRIGYGLDRYLLERHCNLKLLLVCRQINQEGNSIMQTQFRTLTFWSGWYPPYQVIPQRLRPSIREIIDLRATRFLFWDEELSQLFPNVKKNFDGSLTLATGEFGGAELIAKEENEAQLKTYLKNDKKVQDISMHRRNRQLGSPVLVKVQFVPKDINKRAAKRSGVGVEFIYDADSGEISGKKLVHFRQIPRRTLSDLPRSKRRWDSDAVWLSEEIQQRAPKQLKVK